MIRQIILFFSLMFSGLVFADNPQVTVASHCMEDFNVTWQYCQSGNKTNCSDRHFSFVMGNNYIFVPSDEEYDTVYISSIQSRSDPTHIANFTFDKCSANYNLFSKSTLALTMDYLGNGDCALY